MRALDIVTQDPSTPTRPSRDGTPPGLHLVQPERREQADDVQQRQAFRARCGEVADLLARTERLEDRIWFYRQGIFTWRELSTAAALYPELMPVLNGEWEWIALTLDDNFLD